MYGWVQGEKLQSSIQCPQAVVDVDEVGTVAAAATAVMMNRCAMMDEEPPVVLVFDRPFIFSILHSQSSTPIFIGVVRVPPVASSSDPPAALVYDEVPADQPRMVFKKHGSRSGCNIS